MTEDEWLTYSKEPKVMLSQVRPQASNRKKRLFGCACCRRIWGLIGNEKSQSAVDLAERFAGGLVTEEQRAVAHAEAEAIAVQANAKQWIGANPHPRALWACANVLHKYAGIAVNAYHNAADVAQCHALVSAGFHDLRSSEAQALYTRAYHEELAAQCDIVRELFERPFRPTASRREKQQRRKWLDTSAGAARKLAEAIYADWQFADAPVLADALEEAGCTDESIVAHLRAPEPHVHGCWAIDLILGKE
jgi:hypothetical protein